MIYSINCNGLKCPLPILKTRLKLNTLRQGDQLMILADDPGFIKDFHLFAFQADLKILEMSSSQGNHSYLVEVLK